VTRFRFRLERVLGVRRIEEELARARWLEAELVARAAEERVDALTEVILDAQRELGVRQDRGVLRPAEILLRHASIDRLMVDREQGRRRARVLREAAERERISWSARQSSQRGLERLRERQLDQHRREEEQSSARALDEQALLRSFATARRLGSSPRLSDERTRDPSSAHP
jgi:flagellar export protein FliJ